jgi:hypothetical protein
VEFSNEIFEKALNQPLFASMQAELCRRLHTHYDPSDAKYTDNIGKQLTFRRVLLKNCQNEFVRFEHLAKEGVEIEATVARRAMGQIIPRRQNELRRRRVSRLCTPISVCSGCAIYRRSIQEGPIARNHHSSTMYTPAANAFYSEEEGGRY